MRATTGLEIDFINGALGGYSTYESYGRLWSRLRIFKPDIVIINHGWNDLYYFDDKYIDDPFLWKDGFYIKQFTKSAIIPAHTIDPYISWSQLLSTLRYLSAKNNISIGELGPIEKLNKKRTTATDAKSNSNKFGYRAEGLNIFRKNIELFNALSQLNNFDLFVCKQPTLFTATTNEKDRKRCKFDLHAFGHDAHVHAFQNMYGIIDSVVSTSNSISTETISGISEYFYDHVHLTEEGTSALSELVSNKLLDNFFNQIEKNDLNYSSEFLTQQNHSKVLDSFYSVLNSKDTLPRELIDAALHASRKNIELFPENVNAYWEHAEIYMNIGNYDEAIEIYQEYT